MNAKLKFICIVSFSNSLSKMLLLWSFSIFFFWYLCLFFRFVQKPSCPVCWVIVEHKDACWSLVSLYFQLSLPYVILLSLQKLCIALGLWESPSGIQIWMLRWKGNGIEWCKLWVFLRCSLLKLLHYNRPKIVSLFLDVFNGLRALQGTKAGQLLVFPHSDCLKLCNCLNVQFGGV